MVYIVPRSHADNMLNRFGTALGMYPVVFPLLGCQRLQQGKIRFADHAKLLDRLTRIAILIMSAAHPRIRFFARKGGPRRSQTHRHTKPTRTSAAVRDGTA